MSSDRVIYNATKHARNMSTVKIEQELSVICSNQSTADEETCDRSAQGISLSTPIIMMTFGVLGNILALLVLYSSRRESQARRTVFFVMLAGLAWTDLIGQLAVSPIAVVVYANGLNWVGGVPLCLYHGFMMVSFGLVTPLIVCCMSFERFLAIRFSYYYARRITRRKALLTFVACWCVTLVFSAAPFVGFGSYELQFPGSWCFLNFHKESLADTVYAGIFSSLNTIAILTMIVCNVTVAGILCRMRRSRQLSSSPSIDRRLSVSGIGGSSTSGVVIRGRRHSDMEAQMIWFLGLITVAFSVCWLPLNVHILVMQFTGTTNRGLDLKVIRMASCNQILDPWLYVIFRKNSILRIIRRLKACWSTKKQPPRHCPIRSPRMRYVLGNRSFTCEATTVGKTVLGVHRGVGLSPTMCKHMLSNGCVSEPRRSVCSGNSLDSVDQLVSFCSCCDNERGSHSAANPVIDLSLGHSPTASQAGNFQFDMSDHVPNPEANPLVDQQKKEEAPHKSKDDPKPMASAPLLSKKAKPLGFPVKFLRSNHTFDSNDSYGTYYSLDSTNHPSITENHAFTHKILPTTPTQPSIMTFPDPPASIPNSQMMTFVKKNHHQPESLTFSNPTHFLVSPPLATPELLCDSPPLLSSRLRLHAEPDQQIPKMSSSPTHIPLAKDSQLPSPTLALETHGQLVENDCQQQQQQQLLNSADDLLALRSLHTTPTPSASFLSTDTELVDDVFVSSDDEIFSSTQTSEPYSNNRDAGTPLLNGNSRFHGTNKQHNCDRRNSSENRSCPSTTSKHSTNSFHTCSQSPQMTVTSPHNCSSGKSEFLSGKMCKYQTGRPSDSHLNGNAASESFNSSDQHGEISDQTKSSVENKAVSLELCDLKEKRGISLRGINGILSQHRKQRNSKDGCDNGLTELPLVKLPQNGHVNGKNLKTEK